jgi:long-chain fatty acid transport protein
MPDIESANDLTRVGGTTGSGKSETNKIIIPAVSLATKVNDNFYWGIGM